MKFAAVIAWLAIFALQVSLWPQITVRFLPAFAFAAALAWGTVVNPRVGWWSALGSGLALDLYAQHDFGMITLASLAGYGAALVLLRGYLAGSISWGPVLVAALVGAGTYEFVLLLWNEISVDGFPLLAAAFGTGTLNVTATFVAFLLTAGVASWSAGRFDNRGSRHEGSLRYR